MLQDIYENAKEYMQKSLQSLQKDFATLRSGRVSVNILDNVRVNYNCSSVLCYNIANLRQLCLRAIIINSNIIKDIYAYSTATTIVINPWEKPLLKDIEKAIQEANIGVNPNNDGECIKLFFPPMTSEQRKDIAKQAKAMGEKAKIAIRNIRQDSNNAIKKLEKEKAITTDESKKGSDEIQKITDEYIKKIDAMVKTKEEEILKV